MEREWGGGELGADSRLLLFKDCVGECEVELEMDMEGERWRSACSSSGSIVMTEEDVVVVPLALMSLNS